MTVSFGSDGKPLGMAKRERSGLLFAALCAVNGAFVPAFAKLTTNAGDPLIVAVVTTLCAAALAAAVLAVQGNLSLLVRPPHGFRLLLVGCLGTSIAFVLFFTGAQRSTAVETVLCLQIEPAYSMLFAWWFLRHRPTPRRLAAIALLLIGIFLAVGEGGFAFSPGVWLLLATPLCWQISHLVVLRGLAGVPPGVITGARYVHGGMVLLAYWVVSGGAGVTDGVDKMSVLRQLPLLAIQGFVLSYGGTYVWYMAIARLDLSRTTAIVVPSIPLLSIAASFALLGEVPNGMQWAGFTLTAAGVLAFVTAPGAVTEEDRIPSVTAPIETPASDRDLTGFDHGSGPR